MANGCSITRFELASGVVRLATAMSLRAERGNPGSGSELPVDRHGGNAASRWRDAGIASLLWVARNPSDKAETDESGLLEARDYICPHTCHSREGACEEIDFALFCLGRARSTGQARGQAPAIQPDCENVRISGWPPRRAMLSGLFDLLNTQLSPRKAL